MIRYGDHSIFSFCQVTKVRPNDKDAKAKFSECSKIVNRMAFERAIAVESDKKPIVETLNLDAMSECTCCIHRNHFFTVSSSLDPASAIDDSYDGPTLPESGPTADFMIELMEHFKNQKQLHQKFAYRVPIIP